MKPLQIKELALSKFDANICNYPRFLSKDFVDLVLCQVYPLGTAFTLRKCEKLKDYKKICDEESTSLIKFIDIVEVDEGTMI